MEKMVDTYVEEIIRIHGVPLSIMSDRDSRITSRFWKSFKEAMGMKLCLSTACNPQMDGQSEKNIQTLEGMLQACALEFPGS